MPDADQDGFRAAEGGKGRKQKVSTIPRDPMILLSYVHTQLRDRYSSLEEMCRELELEQASIEHTLAEAGFAYDPERNCFR